MKFFVAMFLAVSATATFAGDRAIYDLMYLPKAGTFFGSTEALYAWGKATQHDDVDGDIADLKYNGYVLQQTVGYSIVDSLFVTAAMSYQNLDVESDVNGGDTDTYTYPGISDPTIEARFRALDTEHLVDIIVGAEIATGDSKTATADKDGNQKNGGHIVNAAIEMGRNGEGFQTAVQLGVKHFFKATDNTSGVETESNAHSAYNLKGSFQYTLTESSYINPFAEFTFTNAYNDDAGSKTEQKTQIDLGAEYKYLLSQNLLLRAGIKYTNNENAVIDGVETREDMLLTFLAGANYQF